MIFSDKNTFKQYFVCHMTAYRISWPINDSTAPKIRYGPFQPVIGILNKFISWSLKLNLYKCHNNCPSKYMSTKSPYVPNKIRWIRRGVNKAHVWSIASIRIFCSRYYIWFYQILFISLTVKHYHSIQLPPASPCAARVNILKLHISTIGWFLPTGTRSPLS